MSVGAELHRDPPGLDHDAIGILIVEDNPGDARLVIESLRHTSLAVRVTQAATLADAERQLRGLEPDLVLLDLSLPDSTGLDTVRAIRMAAANAAIVVLTGTDDRELAVAALGEGAQDYLVKGLHNGDFLERAVRFALSRRELVATLEDRTERLEETGAELAAILDGSPTPMLVVDRDGIVRKVNRAAVEFSRRSRAQVVGLRGGEALGCLQAYEAPHGCGTGAECEGCPIRRAVDETLETNRRIEKKPVTKTLRGETGDAVFQLEISTSPVETTTGRMVLVCLEDVTARTTAERAVRDSELRYRHLFENNLSGVYLSTVDGRLIDSNSAFERMLGIDAADDVSGIDVVGLWVDPEQRRRFVRDVVEHGQVGDVEVEIRRPDGSHGWLLVNATLAPGSHDGRQLIEGTAIDITERRRTAALQREQLVFLETLLDAIPHPVFYKGADGRYRGCNRAFEKFTGNTVDQLIGRTADDIQPTEFAAEYTERDRVLFERPGTQVYESQVVAGDGTVRNVEFSKATYVDGTGAVAGLVGVINDLTERRQMEEALHQAQKMEALGQLAGGVAHDFNNLLQAMMWLVEEIGGPDARAEIRDADVAELQRLVTRATQLTRQLLLFSRRETASPEVLDLNDVLRSSEELLRRLLRENIRIVAEPADRPAPVVADAGQLEQVIMNLAVNAQDAMPEGGRLQLALTLDDGHACLEVADSGSGIPDDVIDRVFEPFFTTKERGKGTGLGLSVVHGIISSNGGAIEISSEAGRGTTFHIRFPLVSADELPPTATRASAPTPAPGVPDTAGTVLVVDDEPAVLDVLRRTLEHDGYDVITAGSVESATEALDGRRLSLLITDMMLPDGTGLELVDRIGEQAADVPVIVVSGYTDKAIGFHDAAGAGRMGFLQKPFSMSGLRAAVLDALGG